MTDPDDSDARRGELLRQRAEAMAAVQGWALVAHSCAVHHGHPHAEQMMADDVAAIEAGGAMALVLAALGDELGDEIGHDVAVDTLRLRIGAGERPVQALAGAMAEAIGYDGARALATQQDRRNTAEFWEVLDGDEPDQRRADDTN